MGKYFNRPNKKINEDEVELITFNDFLKYKDERQINLIIKEMVYNFIEGKDVTEGKKGFKLLKVPNHTGDYETDYVNITDYLEELCTLYLNTKPDDEFDKSDKYIFEDFDNDVKKVSIEDRIDFTESFSKAMLNKYLPVEFDQKANTLKLENTIKNAPLDRYQAFKDFKQTWTRRNKREEPKWYEFGKRYRNYKEKKALDKYENYLKQYGITDNLINRAKEGKIVSKDKFDNWKVKTCNETFNKYSEISRSYNINYRNNQNFSKYQAISYVNLLIEYRQIEQDHRIAVLGEDEFSKKSYNDIDKKLKEEKENLIRYMDLENPTLKKTYVNLFKVASIDSLKDLSKKLYEYPEKDTINFIGVISEDIQTTINDNDDDEKDIDEYYGLGENSKNNIVEGKNKLQENENSL